MKTLLYIMASPRKDSASTKAASAFIDSYKTVNPNDKIVTLDLFKYDLPSFDGHALDAKYSIMTAKNATPEQAKAWKKIEDVIVEFKSADKYLFSIPMWNFGIPYRLKHFLDVILQPGYTFSFSPDSGYKGLVTGKRAAVIYARGGEYSDGKPGSAFDFQKKYMDIALGFIGLTDIINIIVEPTLGGDPNKYNSVLNEATTKSKELAKAF